MNGYNNNKLIYRHLGIETQHEHIVFMRKDCHVCVAEGFEALTRVRVQVNGKSIVASLNVLTNGNLLESGEIGLSNSAEKALNVSEGEGILVGHLDTIESLSYVRAKIYGKELKPKQYDKIIEDIVAGNYSNVHLASFITACAGEKLSSREIIALTKAMITCGNRIYWGKEVVADKHCIGGLPGNRTTPIVVSIIASFGLTIPKTSSRAITSPAGTADTMETITRVDLTEGEIRQVVEQESGCVVWGGSARLSPADDILIRVERALNIDSEGQMIASVLSKKIAAGSTHLVIDIPVGDTAKVRSEEEAQRLKYLFTVVGKEVGLELKVVITDGNQPVGKGIGPALEAKDVLQVLRNQKGAPRDLKERSIRLAGELLELTGIAGLGKGNAQAREVLESGKALEKFKAICEAQGRYSEPETGKYTKEVIAQKTGIISEIDNRKLANLAKLAGAPTDMSAGVWFDAPLGKKVNKGDTLYKVYSGSQGELDYALNFLNTEYGKDIVRITG